MSRLTESQAAHAKRRLTRRHTAVVEALDRLAVCEPDPSEERLRPHLDDAYIAAGAFRKAVTDAIDERRKEARP